MPRLVAVLLLLASSTAAPITAQPNLPIYTSPIDITGQRIVLQATIPDRDTGKPITTALPTALAPPSLSPLVATPLSTQFDQYWSVVKDSKTGLTPRDQSCSGDNGITAQVQKAVKNIGSSYSAYNITCNLVTTGRLLAQQVGATLFVAYLLPANTVSFTATTPFTCNGDHGNVLCPNDPHFTVIFAIQLETILRTPDLCHLSAEDGTVELKAVNIEGVRNLAGTLSNLVDSLFLGNKFSAAERSIEATEKQVPLPLAGYFSQLRQSGACSGADAIPARLLKQFPAFAVDVHPPQGILFQMIHPPISAPTLQIPNPAAVAAPPAQPTFIRPVLSTTRPAAAPGTVLTLSGSHFPPNANLATVLPITFIHGGLGLNSQILGGPCFGGGTDLQWGAANAPLHLQRLPPADASSTCASTFAATSLTPATAYQFKARDCDSFTCSLYSTPVNVTTSRGGPDQGKVLLTLDAATPLGTAILTPAGTFDSTVTLPPALAPGNHPIRAVSGVASAQLTLAVTGPVTPTAQATLTLVGLLYGESGCPNHPITSTATGSAYMLSGTGFTPGPINLRLDAPTGFAAGTATAQPDGTFCQKMPAIPATQVGRHTLLGLQSGNTRAQTSVTFVAPTVVR